VIDLLPHVQVLAFTSTNKATSTFREAIRKLGSTARCYSYDPLHVHQTEFGTLAGISQHQIVAGTPDYLLELIRRNALKTRELKLLVIDDVDQLIEAGFEEQMLEVYRHIPLLAQIVASCTVLSPSVINTTAKFLVDPLRISVNRDEGISMSAQHFFAKVTTELKLTVLRALISRLGSNQVVVLCRYVNQISILDDNRNPYVYRLEETTGSWDREERIRAFKRYSRATLLTTEAAFPIADLSNLSIILIIYDIPSDTDEIRVIYDLERHHGAEMIELLWDGKALH
ncbi:Eukaryotic initiation factor 4A-III, partial [Ceratobasidium sp. 423]